MAANLLLLRISDFFLWLVQHPAVRRADINTTAVFPFPHATLQYTHTIGTNALLEDLGMEGIEEEEREKAAIAKQAEVSEEDDMAALAHLWTSGCGSLRLLGHVR